MTEANAEQRAYWNEVSGPKWVAVADTVNAQIEPLGLAAMDAAGIAQGHRVLDVGCGCGQTTLELASRVGEAGDVTGADISAPMLADARARAERAKGGPRGSIAFVEADAQVHAFEPASFDLVFSRFGVMFFEDPVAAFSNLARSTKPGGTLCFICWQSIVSNPWMLLPAQAAAAHVEMPAPGPLDAPGPFAFSDGERVRGLLGDAGWSDIACDDHSGDLAVGSGQALPEIIEFLQQMGPAGRALAEATPEVRARAADSMNEALAPYYRDGALRMGFATWIVKARRA